MKAFSIKGLEGRFATYTYRKCDIYVPKVRHIRTDSATYTYRFFYFFPLGPVPKLSIVCVPGLGKLLSLR
jgi:hypothetical protein